MSAIAILKEWFPLFVRSTFCKVRSHRKKQVWHSENYITWSAADHRLETRNKRLGISEQPTANDTLDNLTRRLIYFYIFISANPHIFIIFDVGKLGIHIAFTGALRFLKDVLLQ